MQDTLEEVSISLVDGDLVCPSCEDYNIHQKDNYHYCLRCGVQWKVLAELNYG